jgi:hypothetical protein
VDAASLTTCDAASRTGCVPFRDVSLTSRCRAGVAADPTDPRGVGLTFGARPSSRIEVFGSSIPLRPFAGPWGLPRRRWHRPIARTGEPGSRGLRLSFRVSPEASRRDAAPRGAEARHASPGVLCPSAHARPAGPLARGFQPSLRSVLRVSTLSTASSPRALPTGFQAGALLGFRPPGVFSSRSVGTPSGARHLHDVGRPPLAPPSAAWAVPSAARPASPSSRLPVPGIRTVPPAVTPAQTAASPPGLLPP